MKKCSKCKLVKNDCDFYNDHKRKTGLTPSCKDCHKKRSQNPLTKQKRAKYIKEYYSIPYNKNRRRELKRKIRKNPIVQLNERISNGMRNCLKNNKLKKNRGWENTIGYTIHDLKKHLENLFLPGMSWENISEWHVDHIKPINTFDISSIHSKEFKECWSLQNLRPLWATDNYSRPKDGSDILIT